MLLLGEKVCKMYNGLLNYDYGMLFLFSSRLTFRNGLCQIVSKLVTNLLEHILYVAGGVKRFMLLDKYVVRDIALLRRILEVPDKILRFLFVENEAA